MSPDRKRELRAVRLAARRSMPAAEREAQDGTLCRLVRDFLLSRRAGTVAAYVPIKEPGGPDLPAALVARVLLPVLRADNDLDWAWYAGDPAPARRGLLEPTGPRLGVTAVASADVVIVPALAVDASGTRLGRGGGSYDRALARLAPGTPVVALLYRGEFALTPLPAEPHDRPVTAALTPDGWCDVARL